jgi:hypothetical protein
MLSKSLQKISVATRRPLASMGLVNPSRTYNLSLMDRVKEKFH